MSLQRIFVTGVAGLTMLAGLAACATPEPTAEPAAPADAPVGEMAPTTAPTLAGDLPIDGSSTVYPITEAVAEDFMAVNPDARVTVAFSGTGGGFKKFCNKETMLSGASRPIKDEETTQCQEAGIEPIGFEVAYDGLAVVVNPANDWLECITVAELNKMWAPEAEGQVMKWSDVNPAWPAEDLKLYGPGTDSGTFDYFTEEINGETDASRADFTASEDDNVLVQGVTGDRAALGYFGLAYYEENKDKLKLVQVDGGKGCVAPSLETVRDGTYVPLSRPLFMYADAKTLPTDALTRAFMKFYIENGAVTAERVGYVPSPDATYQQDLQTLESMQ